MRMVIDIPEEVKHKVYAYGLSLSPSDKEQLINAIMNGTPLPKGHGRLIDENKINKCEQVGLVIKDDNVIRCLVTDAPTIIEADKAESEE